MLLRKDLENYKEGLQLQIDKLELKKAVVDELIEEFAPVDDFNPEEELSVTEQEEL